MNILRIEIENIIINTEAVTALAPQSFEIDAKFEKKLDKMGQPEVWLKYIDSEGYTESVLLVPSPLGGSIEAKYDSVSMRVNCEIGGIFEIQTFEDAEHYQGLLSGSPCFIDAITLTSANGRAIKFPKDEYGMADAVQVPVAGSEGEGQEIRLSAMLMEK